MVDKPKIGLTMRLEEESRRFYLGRDYGEALEGCGGTPYHLPLIPNRDYLIDAVRNLDGILLPGSDTDVDPASYGEDPRPQLGRVIPEKDRTDFLVLAEAERLKIPVLAICFGMQILNVYRGGTLIQDIESQMPGSLKHEQGRPLGRSSHSIEIEKDSFLSRLAGAEQARVNSHHHQAIDKIGENLKISARAKDKIVECVEETRLDRFNFGVQWHPEYSWQTDTLSGKIFETFIEACAKYKRERKQ